MANLLKKSNLKSTKNRVRIIDIISFSPLPINADEIYKQCVLSDDTMNLSTVYRTLAVLVSKNILIKQVRQDGVAYYQINSHDHKHLLICDCCGVNISLDTCPLDEMLHSIADSTNFKITAHNIELYGVCNNCQKSNNNNIN